MEDLSGWSLGREEKGVGRISELYIAERDPRFYYRARQFYAIGRELDRNEGEMKKMNVLGMIAECKRRERVATS